MFHSDFDSTLCPGLTTEAVLLLIYSLRIHVGHYEKLVLMLKIPQWSRL